MLQSSNIQISANFGSAVEVVLGLERELTFQIANLSTDQKAYNVSATLTLADGLTLQGSDPMFTTTTEKNQYEMTNIKDLAPLEEGMTLSWVLRSALTTVDGQSVSFGQRFSATLRVSWDSLPRGQFDAGNEQFYAEFSFEMTTVPISVRKILPTKWVKGGGDFFQEAAPFTCYLEVYNNAMEATTFEMVDILPDGFAYLGNFSVVEGAVAVGPPVSYAIAQDGTHTLRWAQITLDAGAYLKVGFDCALYNRFAQNGIGDSGDTIAHQSKLSSSVTVDYGWGKASYWYAIFAMDVLIQLWASHTIVDCFQRVDYTMSVLVSQYRDQNNVTVTALIPDGQSVQSDGGGAIQPVDTNTATPIFYNLGTLKKGTQHTIALSTEVADSYGGKAVAVACGDQFEMTASLRCEEDGQVVEDRAAVSQQIVLPTITKKILGRYHRDMTEKTVDAMAPLDFVTYELSYDSTGIRAAQLDINLDDFFPLHTTVPTAFDTVEGPLVTPTDIAPHGVRFGLGDLPSGTRWTVRCTSQIIQQGSPFTYNLFKLNGLNSTGTAYSHRTAVDFVMGTPNLVLTRTVTGIAPRAVEGGQSFQVEILCTNVATSSATDGFSFNLALGVAEGITVAQDSLQVEGTGTAGGFSTVDGTISLAVTALKVGEFLKISYTATLPQSIPPDYRGRLTVTADLPYTQAVDTAQENLRYDTTTATSGYTLKSLPVTVTKTYDGGVKQVSSTIDYTVTVRIPRGTTVYQSSLISTSEGNQRYLEKATVNAVAVDVVAENGGLTFPVVEKYFDGADNIDLTYTFQTQVMDVATHRAQVVQDSVSTFRYQDETGNTTTVDCGLAVTIESPKVTMVLSGQSGTFGSTTPTVLTLQIYNNANVPAVDFGVTIPVAPNLVLRSYSATLGSLEYDESGGVLRYAVDKILPRGVVFVQLELAGEADIRVSEGGVILAQNGVYYNEITTNKNFYAPNSNEISLTVAPDVFLSIYAPYRRGQEKSLVLVSANTVATVPYTFYNRSGGIGDFILKITPSKYPYNVVMDGQVVRQVAANQAFSDTLFKDVPPETVVPFQLVFTVPDVQLYDKNPYAVLVCSAYNEDVGMENRTAMIDP